MTEATLRAQGAVASTNVELASLLRLRWAWVLVQLAATAVAMLLLEQKVQLVHVGWVVLVTMGSNLAATGWLARRAGHREALPTALVALDIVLFTVVLHVSGGPENPFGFLYLVPLSLGAYTLSAPRMWALAALTLLCSAALFWFQPAAAEHANHAHHGHHMAGSSSYSLHLQGMWLGLFVAAVFIVLFVGRLSGALRRREAQLRKLRERSERVSRMASLTTLAAGAAHELATPLGTIAVVSKELGRQLEGEGSALGQQAQLIRQEVTRCREILDRLSGSVRGEAFVDATVEALLSDVLMGFADKDRITVANSEDAQRLSIPRGAVVTAVRALLQNALDASAAEDTVELRAAVSGAMLEVTVRDEGAGMDAETLEHALEPFFTTKESGHGLGLFLAASVAEQLGGDVHVSSEAGAGTTVVWRIPAKVASAQG